MVQHASLTGAELHEPKGVDAASSGEVYVADGAGSGSWASAFSSATSTLELLLDAESTADQNPTTTDTPMQITFGAGQLGASDPLQLSSSGDITFNDAGQYIISLELEMGRTGSTAVADLLTYLTVDSTAITPSYHVKIVDADDKKYINIMKEYTAASTEVLEAWLVRDSAGDDQGGLLAFSSTDAGVPDSFSAKIKVYQVTVE